MYQRTKGQAVGPARAKVAYLDVLWIINVNYDQYAIFFLASFLARAGRAALNFYIYALLLLLLSAAAAAIKQIVVVSSSPKKQQRQRQQQQQQLS